MAGALAAEAANQQILTDLPVGYLNPNIHFGDNGMALYASSEYSDDTLVGGGKE
jgi:hypothetical protein